MAKSSQNQQIEAHSKAKQPVQEPPAETRMIARNLYWQGWRITDIGKHLLVPRTTVHRWKSSDKWDRSTPIERIEGSSEAKITLLINKENKSNADYKELDALMRVMERAARINTYNGTAKESDLNPNINARNVAPRKKRRNHLSEHQIEQLKQNFEETIFPFQMHWYHHRNQRNRFILKSRQIGATWYFAREALLDGLETGRNQIFISASKKQALVFRAYMVDWVFQVTGVTLTGEDITLANGSEMIFLGTNFRTTQSYSGNIYIDEAMWIPRFQQLNETARPMATHQHLRRTYITTPSTDGHEAYPLWTGEEANKGRKEKFKIDLSDKALKEGTLGADRYWRQRVTLEDAMAQGFNLVDLQELKDETSPDDFANKYMCEFIKENESAFKFSELQACMVDADLLWHDFKRYHERPFSNKPVWLGHDPSSTGDKSSLAIVAPPEKEGADFRVLERKSSKGANFETQAASIIAATKKYHVDKIDIDTSGIGLAVHELVSNELPRANPIIYSVDSKMMMVLKAQSVMRKGRLKFDMSDTELVRSFLSIKPTLTRSQKQITFDSGRSEATGHADAAWSVMHTLINEPLDGSSLTQQKSFMVASCH